MIYFFISLRGNFFFHLDEEKKGDQLVASFAGSHELQLLLQLQLQLLLRLEIISSVVLTFSAANEKRINFFRPLTCFYARLESCLSYKTGF